MRMNETIRARMVKLADEATANSEVKVYLHVVEQIDAGLGICQTAERVGADIICMNSHRKKAIAATVLGSVSQAVLTGSRRPVLLLRPVE